MLKGQDIEAQAKELRKLLIVAGIDVESDMSNPEVLDIIKNVLQNFDPLNEDDQEAAVFATTFNHFR